MIRKLALHWKILIAMVLGVVWALISGQMGWNKWTIDWIDPFGKIFINCLKFIAIPLVLFSIVSGVASLGNVRQLGRIGAKTLLLYLTTTVFSVSTGLLLVNFLQPGKVEGETLNKNRLRYELWVQENGYQIKDGEHFLLKADSALIASVTAQMNEEAQSATYQQLASKKEQAKQVQNGPLQPLVDMVPENLVLSLSDSRLMLQVIFFALFFGIAMSLLSHEKVKTVSAFFEGMNEVFVKMVNVVMQGAPFFVFCLMAGVLAKVANTPREIGQLFASLGHYALTVVLGLLMMLTVIYPLMLKLFKVPIGYKAFFQKLSPAQFLAFSTSSSAATLPVTIKCVENLGIPKKVSDFVLPIGATVNMDGTSLYQAVAVIFLAQFHGVDLSVEQQLGIVATTTLASIGAAAVPSAGLIMLMFVLTSVELNPLWIVIIYPIDRLLDMCRTVINVTSDATVAAIVARGEKEQ
jgi:Na+/H+-dicarboxylate symporter